MREIDRTKKQMLAGSMLHSVKIADIHYATQNGKSIYCSKIINTIRKKMFLDILQDCIYYQ